MITYVCNIYIYVCVYAGMNYRNLKAPRHNRMTGFFLE